MQCSVMEATTTIVEQERLLGFGNPTKWRSRPVMDEAPARVMVFGYTPPSNGQSGSVRYGVLLGDGPAGPTQQAAWKWFFEHFEPRYASVSP
jgi:hypothetical protein